MFDRSVLWVILLTAKEKSEKRRQVFRYTLQSAEKGNQKKTSQLDLLTVGLLVLIVLLRKTVSCTFDFKYHLGDLQPSAAKFSRKQRAG